MQESSEQPSTPDPKVTGSSGLGSDSGGRTATGLQRRFVDFLAWAITIIWCGSMIGDAAIKDYDPNPSVHVAMLALVGVAFSSGLIRKD